MRPLILLISIISLSIASCKKDESSPDLTNKGFIITQYATCVNGTAKITNVNGVDYIRFDSPTFVPAPNTWYRGSLPGSLSPRFKTGSDVSPKDAPFTSGADMNALSTSDLCK